MDMRGWGLSDGESMYLDSIDTFVEDINALYQHIHSLPRYKDVKSRFLMGKSIGGTVTAFCAAKYPEHWTGLIGLSGAYELDPNIIPSPIVMSILNGLAWLVPKTPLKSLFDEHLIVADQEALQRWRDDKLCCKDKIRVGYIVVFIDSLKQLPQTIVPQIKLPMLMMCGDDDHVVALSGHEHMIQNSRHHDKQLKTYPKGRHNLLQEPSIKDQIITDIKKWICAHST
jgi:alpha-beta hydrolase superfamily lysophospholipase